MGGEKKPAMAVRDCCFLFARAKPGLILVSFPVHWHFCRRWAAALQLACLRECISYLARHCTLCVTVCAHHKCGQGDPSERKFFFFFKAKPNHIRFRTDQAFGIHSHVSDRSIA